MRPPPSASKLHPVCCHRSPLHDIAHARVEHNGGGHPHLLQNLQCEQHESSCLLGLLTGTGTTQGKKRLLHNLSAGRRVGAEMPWSEACGRFIPHLSLGGGKHPVRPHSSVGLPTTIQAWRGRGTHANVPHKHGQRHPRQCATQKQTGLVVRPPAPTATRPTRAMVSPVSSGRPSVTITLNCFPCKRQQSWAAGGGSEGGAWPGLCPLTSGAQLLRDYRRSG